MTMNLLRSSLIFAAGLLLAGCGSADHAPTVDVLGSYFPAWIVCIVLGLALTLITRQIFIASKLNIHLHPLAVVYPCLMIFTRWPLAALFQKLNSMDDPKPQPVPPADNPPPVAPPAGEWRKAAGRILSIVLILAAMLLALLVWNIIKRHPRTDDATAQANVIGVAPRIRGQIIALNVQDNQDVKEGDVLFEIDPADYRLALTNAVAALASLDQQIEVARGHEDELKYQVKAAEAGVEQSKAQLQQATDTLQRLQPLLEKGFTTADDVEKAQTAVQVATASLAAQEQHSNQAKSSFGNLATLLAQRPSAVAAVDLAGLQLSYCMVTAAFPGKVVNLNISVGAYANAGVPVFALLDTRKWYVLANFREGELRHFSTGSPVDVYLLSAPGHHFNGKVQGIGWAVLSRDEIDVSHGVPAVPRELNWVHIAQRFPVRIEVEDPDPALFRMGASAVAIIK